MPDEAPAGRSGKCRKEAVMKHVLGVSVFVLVVAVAGCGPAPVDVDAARSALREADASYHQSLEAMDLDAWTSMYAPDAKLYPPNGPMVTGAEAIRAFADQVRSTPGFRISVRPADLDVAASGDFGYTMGMYDMTMTGPDGQPVSDRGRDFHVWQKQPDGSWKVLIDMWNSEVPMPAVK
jgi:ketosteroid isomerase-like protein